MPPFYLQGLHFKMLPSPILMLTRPGSAHLLQSQNSSNKTASLFSAHPGVD